MSAQLTIKKVTRNYAYKRVLDDISLTVRPGEKLGVVGENGSGKSTLLRLIAGQDVPDDGEITVMAQGIGCLGQVLDLPENATAGDAIDAALVEIRLLEQQITAAAAQEKLDELGDLLTAFELRDGYSADARVEAAMSALGIGDVGRERRLGTLSGGERARLALAGVLSAEPELLLLDEPTNHLDDQALAWLESELKRHKGTLVVVTHDRLLLERVTTAIVEVENRTITRYGNGYAGYVAGKRAARQRWEQAYAEWAGEIGHWTEWRGTTAHRVAPARPIRDHNKCKYNGDGRRVQASIRTRVRSASERLERLRAEPVPKPPEPLRLNAPLTAAVREGTVLEFGELKVEAGQRLLVTGPNGAGKSTLLDVLAGVIDTGEVTRNGVIGYLPQETVVREPNQTVLQAFGGSADELEALGLLRREDFATPVGALSIGQRRRLALARLLNQEQDVLLLDEPTNHLSLALVEELEAALQHYPGAVVVASHDRLLRRRWQGEELRMVRSSRTSRQR
ncbi:ABC-F family ATP-binding cassette domain-containing protein [Lentzea sp. BCCO 10_0061]|uniref:ABC-F family ATP-binding cassette domain-containing protein n=1 Tax=Lentzea sokolovensis TaxID=3095429 RepID=A0ABU4V590_9PSEU|nr:ABC-F family ATP-binding cassette domain-containing protein [Lentzea sp. BCCO 10_0061]MDX8146060.1 ABC-F family ATP-binding cassette domain-containing protein [Lentzea sp. BCCO 10_0061]